MEYSYGIAKSAYENGAQLIFTYMREENKEKIEELISEFKGSKAYVLNGASEDELVKQTFEKNKRRKWQNRWFGTCNSKCKNRRFTQRFYIYQAKKDFHMP